MSSDLQVIQKRVQRPTPKMIGDVLCEIQDLAGLAKGIYQNDRDTLRADKLVPILDKIFSLAMEGRARS